MSDYRTPRHGDYYQVGDYSLYAYSQGSSNNKPSIIFEAGLGGFALQWYKVQNALAKDYHTLAYDRSGQGWSNYHEAVYKADNAPEQMAEALHHLLEVMDIAPPYVLVAHSFGGLIARYFAAHYPNEVVGLVLVDTVHEHQFDAITHFGRSYGMWRWAMQLLRGISHWNLLGRVIARFGLEPIRDDVSSDTWQRMVHITSLPKHRQAMRAEVSHIEQFFGKDNLIPDAFGDLPISVVTAGQSYLHQQHLFHLMGDAVNKEHLKLQKELCAMSSRSHHIHVPQANHIDLLSNDAHAAEVVRAIHWLLEQL